MKESALDLANVLESALKDIPEITPAILEKLRLHFVAELGGGVMYVPKQDQKKLVLRNVAIIGQLPPQGCECNKAAVRLLGRKHNLSVSQVYRIRRQAHTAYTALQELWDYDQIDQETYHTAIKILQEKLPHCGKAL